MKGGLLFIRLHSRFYCEQVFTALGALWLVVDVLMVTMFGTPPSGEQGLGVLIGLCVFAFSIAAARLLFNISSVSFRIRNTRANLSIVFGDVFKQTDGAIVVPVNHFFDHELGVSVSPNSVHGQAIQSWETPEDFRAAVDRDLSRVERGLEFEEDLTRKIAPRRRYEIGTIATVERQNSENSTTLFHLLAVAEVEENNRARSNLPALVTALSKGWQYIFERSETVPLVVPLIGSGFGRVGLDEEHLLEVMIATIAEYQARERMPANNITIVLTESLKGKIKLYNVKREWS